MAGEREDRVASLEAQLRRQQHINAQLLEVVMALRDAMFPPRQVALYRAGLKVMQPAGQKLLRTIDDLFTLLYAVELADGSAAQSGAAAPDAGLGGAVD